MNEKIFTLLKQTYSSLGLGDALLKAIADGLAAGATDENIDSLVASQKPILEAMQKANDKRAADAAAKAKADAEAAAKAAKEADEQKRSDLAKQIEELQKELQKKNEPTPPTPPTPPVPPKDDKVIPDWFTAEQKKVAEQNKQMADSMKTLLDSINALKDENEKFKAAKAAEERTNFITQTARELGVPEWREKEGFNITDKMSEDDIKTYLAGVANNIRTNVTAGNHFGVPNFTDDKKAVEEQTKKIAADMVSQL
jgi:colicin import membrane protein